MAVQIHLVIYLVVRQNIFHLSHVVDILCKGITYPQSVRILLQNYEACLGLRSSDILFEIQTLTSLCRIQNLSSYKPQLHSAGHKMCHYHA